MKAVPISCSPGSAATRADRPLQTVLIPFLASQTRLFAAGAALSATTALMGMALLGLSGWFIAATALAGLQAATAIGFDVFMPSAAIRLLALGRTASRYGERMLTHDATFGALAAWRVRLFRGLAEPDAARHLLARPARMLFRLTADIDAVESLFLRLLAPAFAALGAALFAGLVLGFMHGWSGAAMALWLTVAGGGVALATARCGSRHAARRASAVEALRAGTIDLSAGQTELLMTGRLDAQRAEIGVIDDRLARVDIALNRLETNASAAYGVVGTLTVVSTLLAIGWLVGEHTITVPGAALALLISITAVEPFSALRRGAIEAGRTALAARRLGSRASPDRAQAGSTPSLLASGGHTAVAINQVSAAHRGSDEPVLHDISLTLMAGERVALIGPSGAGKSTLLAVMAGELPMRSGQAEVQSHGLLIQRTELFQDTLRDNLRVAAPGADDGRLREVLAAAGLLDEVRAMGAGLDTRLGEGGLGLSGGQSRRLAVARLLLQERPLWLLDEPTEALDATVAHDVLERLSAHAAGRTLLIATHLRREATLADRLLCMQQGRIVADLRRGTTAFDTALRSLRAD